MQGDFPLGITPAYVFVTLILSVIGVLTFLWRITKSLANMEMKMNLMWSDFRKRFSLEDD